MAAPAGDFVDVSGGAVGPGHERVDERGLADPGVAHEDRDGTVKRLADRFDTVVGPLAADL